MHCLFIIPEMEEMVGKGKEGYPAKVESGTRKKVLSADEEALQARSWTVNSMEGAVTRAKDLFLRYYITLVDLPLLLLSILPQCCHASLTAFNSLPLLLYFLCMPNYPFLHSLHHYLTSSQLQLNFLRYPPALHSQPPSIFPSPVPSVSALSLNSFKSTSLIHFKSHSVFLSSVHSTTFSFFCFFPHIFFAFPIPLCIIQSAQMCQERRMHNVCCLCSNHER